ncbi:MAG: redox-regulated ATPase YchF [Phycisphaerae bacterium]|nr:redox-regulated ATPase YchF [Phycisphaerae bacterium]
MKVALIGMPGSGKTTLFSAVTGHEPSPAHMGQEQMAVVKVPDPRLQVLADIYKPERIVPATLDFVDFPGVGLTSPQAQSDFRRHAANIRGCDALVVVLRAFESDAIPPYRDRIDPVADLDELRTEFIFADLEVAANRIERLRKQITKPTPTQEQDKRELALLERCHETLENERPLSSDVRSEEERNAVKSYAFLTLKPLIVAVNVAESDVGKPLALQCDDAAASLALSAEIEAEIAQLDPDDRPEFMADLGITEPALDSLVHACYQALGLVSFLTVGDDEVRAWTIPAGTPAVEAAGKIHTDIARGFIRAETVTYDDLIAAGDIKTAKTAGNVRLEGKTYVVKDGDVINFRFNI